MTDIDKKSTLNKASPTDLVQSVLEAYEKKNQDRVDMLVTNAVKQLKMSRFKPDQTICIGLTYLARINPQIYQQSNSIRELLKSLLRRDQGSTNMKTGKSDMILPVLAANILLASCDGPEIRGIILNKLDQWLTGSQKVADIVLHLLAIICIKCQSDKQTISTLIEMRKYWIAHIVSNQQLISSQCMPSDLSQSVRNLILNECEPSQIILYLQFLDKYDMKHEGLSQALAHLVLSRPMTLASMFQDTECGIELARSIMNLFTKILVQIRLKNRQKLENSINQTPAAPDKLDDNAVKSESKSIIKSKQEVPISLVTSTRQAAEVKYQNNHTKQEEFDPNVIRKYLPPIYIKYHNSNDNDVMNLDKFTLEAILLMLILTEDYNDIKPDWDQLTCALLLDLDKHNNSPEHKVASIYSDWSLTKAYDMSEELRIRLYLARTEMLINLSLENANVTQLVRLLCLFGSNPNSIDKVFQKLENVQDIESIRAEISDGTYFCQLIEFYAAELGSIQAREFLRRLEQV